jgi:hypothetical protein
MGGVDFRQAADKQQLRLQPGGWFYDSPSSNLHVWMLGSAGKDDIVTISF